MLNPSIEESIEMSGDKRTVSKNFRFDTQWWALFEQFADEYIDEHGQQYTKKALIQKLVVDKMKETGWEPPKDKPDETL